MEKEEDKKQHIQNAINALDNDAKRWEKKRDNAENPVVKETYDVAKERAEFEADRIRTKLLETKPVHPQTEKAMQTETDDNPKVGFEKYKNFIKRNFI